MASSDERVPEIPGFYYDQENRRYFRQPPSHFAHLPQYQRLRHPATDESTDNHTTQDRPHPLATPTRTTTLLQQQTNSVFGYVQSHQYRPATGVRSLYERLLVSAERKQSFSVLERYSYRTYYDIAISDSGELLAVVYDAQHHMYHCKFVKVFHVKGPCEIAESSSVLSARFVDIANFDLDLPLVFYRQENKEIIPTVPGDNVLCLELVRKTPPFKNAYGVDDPDPEWVVESWYSCNYQSRPISTLALGPSAQTGYHMAIGTDNGYINLFERQPNDHCVSTYWRAGGPSSVLSLAFSSQNPTLFSGCRNGCITAWDLRAGSDVSVARVMEQRHARIHSSVIGLHPLKDDTYLISSAYNSHLSVWDLRMRRVVWSFANHVNTIRNCRSVLDSCESLLFAAGSDSNIRLWSIRTGALLRTIPVEEYAAPETSVGGPPSLCYTPTLGGTGGPALLIAREHKIAVFQSF